MRYLLLLLLALPALADTVQICGINVAFTCPTGGGPPPPPPPPPPVTTGCPPNSALMHDWPGKALYVSDVATGQMGSVRLPSPAADILAGQRVSQATITESSTGGNPDVLWGVSHCPGVIPALAPCMQHTQYTGGSMSFSIGPKPPGTPWWSQVCELPAGTSSVYLNFRQVDRATGQPSCQFGYCPVWIHFAN